MLFFQSLAGRLFKLVFFSYVILAIIVTGSQLLLEYSLIRSTIAKDIASIGASFSGGVSGAMWELNRAMMKTMAQGICQSSIITGVKITSETGELMATFGEIPSEEPAETQNILSPFMSNTTILTRQTPLGIRELGKLTIYSDRSVALDRIKYSFSIILINSLVKTAGLWLIFYIVITRSLSRPLSSLTDVVSKVEYAAESTDMLAPHYPHDDELGRLIGAMQKMQERLTDAHAQMGEINANLEKMVAERTQSLSEALEFNKTILDALSAHIAILDENGFIVAVNRAWTDFAKWNGGSCVNVCEGVNYISVCKTAQGKDSEEAAAVANGIRDVIMGKRNNYKMQYPCHSPDNKRWFRINVTQVPGTTQRHVVVAHENITELKLAGALLKSAKDSAEEASRAKSEFLANMSHEIRTPMNAIIGLCHLALNTELNAKQKDYLNKVHTAAMSLLSLINDILDFSKIEARKLQVEVVDLNLIDLLDHVGTMLSSKAELKGLEIMFSIASDVPRFLRGDPLRLGQILTNLLSNAVKFTEAGEIVLSVETLFVDEQNALLRFSVRDTGIGIPVETLKNLFQPFTQADSSITRKYGGTGLGLTISKNLVELMGGEIHVESQLGKGSIFSFTVALGVNPENMPFCTIPPSDIKGLKVLAVDDNAAVRGLLIETLSACSFHVVAVDSGMAALEELERSINKGEPYGAVLIDWKMPEMDGIETALRIRHDSKLSGTAVIMMVTAFGREEIQQRAEQIGIQGFLIKPVLPDTLINIMQEALGKTATLSGLVIGGGKKGKAAEQLSGARILVVEDNAINQQVVCEILQNAGITVNITNNGKEAVEELKVNEVHYNAVLMDLQMPVMDGYEATRQIRRDERHRDLPIIAMTAHAMAEEKQKCLEAGMNDHIAKPLDPDQMILLLDKWIHRHRIRPKSHSIKGVEAGSTMILPEELPGIDIKKALDRINGNAALFKQILSGFLKEYQDGASRLRALLSDNDFEASRHFIHTLKGVAGNISATDLFESVKVLEAKVINGEVMQHELCLDDLEAKLNVVLSSALLAIAEPKQYPSTEAERGESQPISDIESIGIQLSEFKRLLGRNSLDAMKLWPEIKEQLKNERFYEKIGLMEQKLQKYDFEGALDSLRIIAEGIGIELR